METSRISRLVQVTSTGQLHTWMNTGKGVWRENVARRAVSQATVISGSYVKGPMCELGLEL
jgi:hypothetical protein